MKVIVAGVGTRLLGDEVVVPTTRTLVGLKSCPVRLHRYVTDEVSMELISVVVQVRVRGRLVGPDFSHQSAKRVAVYGRFVDQIDDFVSWAEYHLVAAADEFIDNQVGGCRVS